MAVYNVSKPNGDKPRKAWVQYVAGGQARVDTFEMSTAVDSLREEFRQAATRVTEQKYPLLADRLAQVKRGGEK